MKKKQKQKKKYQRRVLHALGNQSAPSSHAGPGRRVLYRCNQCGHPWLMDGSHVQVRLEEREVEQLAQELSADLSVLPFATCRLCVGMHGSFEIDEYGDGKGYGFNWEAPDPRGAHLLATVQSLSWLQQQPFASMVADVVHAPQTAHAVLRWLSHLPASPCLHRLTLAESHSMAQHNPPGYGMPGTEGWCWKGGIFQQWCPPLHDEVLVMLAIAVPPDEFLELDRLRTLWQQLAARAEHGHIAGEP